MKAWEKKIRADKLKGDTYVILSNGFSFLCQKVKGKYFVKNDDRTLITKIDKVIKL